MPTTSGRRIKAVTPPGTGGSPTPPPSSAVVVWGPNFGDPDLQDLENQVGPVMDVLALVNTQTIQVGPTISTVGLVDATLTEQVTLTGVAVGPPQLMATTTSAKADTAGFTTFSATLPSGIVSTDFLFLFVGVYAAALTSAADPTATSHVGAGSNGWGALGSPPTFVLDSAVVHTVGLRTFYWDVGFAGTPTDLTITYGTAVTATVVEVHRVAGTAFGLASSFKHSYAATDLDPDPDSDAYSASTRDLVLSGLIHDHAALSQTHSPASGWTQVSDFQASTTGISLGSHTQRRFTESGVAASNHDCTETVGTNAVTVTFAIQGTSITLA